MQTPKFPLWICALALGGTLTLHAQDTPAQAAARAALNQKMNELDANPPAVTPPMAVPATPAVIEVTPAGATLVAEKTAPASTTRAAAVMKTSAPAPTRIAPAPARVKYAVKNSGVTPAPVPNSPLKMSKDEKLGWLLARYKADQITPEEYQQQRAAILAEP